MKRVFLEILLGLGIIFYIGGFGYILVLSYFLYRLIFLRSCGGKESFLEEIIMFIVCLLGLIVELIVIYYHGGILLILWFYIIVYLIVMLFSRKNKN